MMVSQGLVWVGRQRVGILGKQRTPVFLSSVEGSVTI